MILTAARVRTGRLQKTSIQPWLVLAVMSLATFIVFLDTTVINTALPAIARDFRASTSSLQWLVDAYTLPLAGLLLAGGSCSDRYGRRRCLIAGLAVFTGAAVGAALSPTLEILIVMRGLQGVGAAFILPAALSTITAVYLGTERARALGVWAAMTAVSGAVGPLIGGWMVDQISWAAVFWLHVPLAAAVFLGLRAVPETHEGRSATFDIRGALLGTGGLLMLVYALIHGQEAGWTSAETLSTFSAGGILIAGFGVVEMRSPSPMLPLKIFRRSDFTGPLVTAMSVMFGLMVMFFFLTQYFQLVQGKSAFTAGLYILPSVGATIVAVPLSATLNRRLGPKLLTGIAALIILTGVLWLAQLDVDSSYLTVAAGLLTLGFASGLAIAPLTETVMTATPPDYAGTGAAVNYVSRQLGAALGIAVIGTIVHAVYSTKVETGLTGLVPHRVMEIASEGIGAAAAAVQPLEVGTAGIVTNVANTAFVEALTTGFYISAAVIGGALVIGLATIPRKSRGEYTGSDQPERKRPTGGVEEGGLRVDGGKRTAGVHAPRWAAAAFSNSLLGKHDPQTSPHLYS